MQTILFGPYLVPAAPVNTGCADLFHTGYTLEFSGSVSASIPIYRRGDPEEPGTVCLEDYVCEMTAMPFKPINVPCDGIQTPRGWCLRLERVIAHLYYGFIGARALLDVLVELRQCLPFTNQNRVYWRGPRRPDGPALIHPSAAAAGFEVCRFESYGCSLVVEIAWIFPQDRRTPNGDGRMACGYVEFRPRPDRTLGRGKWRSPHPVVLSHWLHKYLRTVCPGPPEDILTERGRKTALESFPWTPFRLLTRKQAFEGRVDFVRKHRELVDRPRELSAALRQAQLYSETTQIGQIVKQLPRILAAAGTRS